MQNPDGEERSLLISTCIKKEFVRCQFSDEDLKVLAEACSNYSSFDIIQCIGNVVGNILAKIISNDSFVKMKDPMGNSIWLPSDQKGGVPYCDIPKGELRVPHPTLDNVITEFRRMKKENSLANEALLANFDNKHGTIPKEEN